MVARQGARFGTGGLHLAEKTMYARCHWCESRLTRSLKKRPLGMLTQWLSACPGPADEHFNMSKAEPGQRQPFSQVDRVSQRRLFQIEQPAAYLAFLAAEGGEPEHDIGEWELNVVT